MRYDVTGGACERERERERRRVEERERREKTFGCCSAARNVVAQSSLKYGGNLAAF